MKLFFIAIAAFLSLIQAQTVVIQGGRIMNTFATCNSYSCSGYARCCQVTLAAYNFQQMMCIESSLTQGYNSGVYMDKVNYPYPQYKWDCGTNHQDPTPDYHHPDNSPSMYHQDTAKDAMSRKTCNGLPSDICNDWNWFWAWSIILCYTLSGFGWVFGYITFVPWAFLSSIYQFFAMLYGGAVWIFMHRINFGQFLLYPVRRWILQNVIQAFGLTALAFPGVSLFLMPILGLWAVSDYLDYQGTEQVGFTLGIPFNQHAQSEYSAYMTASQEYDSHMQGYNDQHYWDV